MGRIGPGSVVAASNPGRDEPFAGLSRLESGELLRDAIRERPAYWGTPNLLVKLLYPVERLPVHAHPDREFARTHLGMCPVSWTGGPAVRRGPRG